MNEKRKLVVRIPSGPSVRRQRELIGLARSTRYYEPATPDPETLSLMRRLDELALEYPFWGSRNVVLQLQAEGIGVNRKRVQRLRRQMGIESFAPKPNLSRPRKEHVKYPYLLRGLCIDRADQVWATDITYIPLVHGWAYLVALIDWYSRKVLAWRLSNTLESRFCVEALEEALARHGRPEVFNTDQGVQFTSDDFTDVLKDHGIRISMDGKGRWLDNVFVERLWRSLKYEEVYIHPCEDMVEQRKRLVRYFEFFNQARRHQALGNDTPNAVYARSRNAGAKSAA